ncbi:integrase, catalytic region, zinc finger, CCHC-type containing protein [Tanacetum coccineum]
MAGDRSRFRNFVKTFTRTVRFENDHFGAIMGYGDYMIGNSVISRVYYVEGLGHNLFSVGQFCDSNLEVAFRKHSCYVRDTNGVELIKEFVNRNLTAYYERVDIFHQKTVQRTPRQNDFVKRRNRTLVEAARTILIFSKALMFLWAEVVATASQDRSYVSDAWADKFRARTKSGSCSTLCTPSTNKELEILFPPMFDEYLEPTHVERLVSPAPAVLVLVTSAGTPSSTTIDQDAPSSSHSPSSLTLKSPSLHQGVVAESTLIEDNPFPPVDNDPFINVFAPEPSSEASSSGDLSLAESPYVTQTLHYLGK